MCLEKIKLFLLLKLEKQTLFIAHFYLHPTANKIMLIKGGIIHV